MTNKIYDGTAISELKFDPTREVTVNYNGKDAIVYSCRAECMHDIMVFRQAIDLIFFETILRPICIDTYYEFACWKTLEELRDILRAQVDSHVMLETLRQCTLKENSLGRDRSIQ